MTVEQLQAAILELLLKRPSTAGELADETGEAPFRIRAELVAMKREHQVAELYDERRRLLWHVTGAGVVEEAIAL